MSTSEREPVNWYHLDPRYLKVKQIMVVVTWPILFAAPPLVLGLALGWWWTFWVAAAAVIPWIAWRLSWQRRYVQQFRYAEGEDELWIEKGILVRHQILVPYGRMQAVTVQSGPLMRANGLAKVELVTASMMSDAELPGLSEAEAEQLRDRLAERGTSQQAGL